MLSRSLLLIPLLTACAAADEPSEADRRIVQTVQRMASFDYAKASPKTREAINRYLNAVAGTDEYFQLTEKYKAAEQKDTLLKLALEKAGTPAAGMAVKLLFAIGQGDAVKAAVAGADPAAAAALIGSVASVGSHETVSMAAGLVTDANTAAPVLEAAVKGLGLTKTGQEALLALAKDGKLPEPVKAAAGQILTTSTDEQIRTAAAAVFQMTERKLPPVAELVKRTGDAVKGQTIYMTWCFTCHQVNGQGIDFGPALSEIGTKLPKEALYDAILNPGTAISFGFEGWMVAMNDGNTYTGLITSETDTELTLKLPGGVVQKSAKSAVKERTKLEQSLMTPGLAAAMTEDDLVNLVEYLATLTKK